VSDSEGPATDVAAREALARLEAVVGHLLDEWPGLGERLREADRRLREAETRLGAAEERKRELEELLDAIRSDRGVDGVELRERLNRVESENEELRTRVTQGAESVDRLLSRLRFLEDQRGDSVQGGGKT
jgi:chromosome segregation ATPase